LLKKCCLQFQKQKCDEGFSERHKGAGIFN
jgi:hypothetical protein